MNSFASKKSYNRVAGGFSPPAPTPHRMRVRTVRFINSNNSLLYLETQNTVASRLLGMILNNFIVNPFRIMSLGSKDHFFEKFLAYELRFCW